MTNDAETGPLEFAAFVSGQLKQARDMHTDRKSKEQIHKIDPRRFVVTKKSNKEPRFAPTAELAATMIPMPQHTEQIDKHVLENIKDNTENIKNITNKLSDVMDILTSISTKIGN